MNKWIYVIVFLVSISIVDAKLFDLNVVTPSSAGCSIFGCTMQGNIDMNGFTIYNVTVVNASVQEFDPIFTSENVSIWLAINSKLDASDQRYNDTLLITGINSSLWQALSDEEGARIANDSYLQGQINYLDQNKLNITDQRYNDTLLIIAVNGSLTQEIQDRIANDSYLQGQILYVYNETFNKLNITDQRYNDTLLIIAVNGSLTQEIQDRIANDSYLQGQILYVYNETFNKLNITDQRYNDTGFIVNLLLEYYNKTESDSIYYNISNPAGYINESYANGSYYPLNSNPAGYINSTDLGNLTNNTWVKVAGDTMTGDLNMSNHSILEVDVLQVHNITGRSPIFINSPMISGSSINATNIYGSFYGDINGQNGTIFGLQVTNGKISNLTVVDNMFVDTNATFNGSLIPAINDTYTLGITDKYWKSFYVTTLYAGNVSTPDIDYLINITNQILLDLDNKLNITDQRYNDTILIGLVNQTLYMQLTDEQNARIANDSYLQGQINYLDINKLDITDQRYNDTYLAENPWLYMSKGTISYNTTLDPNVTDTNNYGITFTAGTFENAPAGVNITSKINTSIIIVYLDNYTIRNTGGQPINLTIWDSGGTLLYSSINIVGNDTIVGEKYFNLTTTPIPIYENQIYYILVYSDNYQRAYTLTPGYPVNSTDIEYNYGVFQYTFNPDSQGSNIYNIVTHPGLVTTINTTTPYTIIYFNESYFNDKLQPIYTDLLNKLNITDQRYNETLFIQTVNETLLGLLSNETQARLDNDSYLQGQINYVYNETLNKLNITDQRYNDTNKIPTALSNLTNDVGFINGTYANLTYYLKSNPAGYINWSQFGTVQLEPTGFDNPTGNTAGTGATLSYNITSHVFSISGTYSFWQKGINYTRSGTDTVLVPVGLTGVYYIYYNNGTLTASNTITGRQFISDYVAVAEIYYNNNTGQVIWQGSETHGHIMDSATHIYIHNFISTRYVSGIAPQNMTVDQNGNLAAHAQLGVSAGAIQDEDLQHTIAAYPFPANIQVFYQIGTAPNWSVKTPDAYPMIYSGDSTGYIGAGGRPPYNRLNAGVWSLTEVTSNSYFLLHLFANNDIRGNRSLFIVQGQNEYATLANARAGATTEINSIITTGLPMAEAKPIATFIVKTTTGMANVPKASFQSIDGVSQFEDWRFSLQTGSSGNIGGTVTLVNTGTGLTGGPITTSGTISLDTTYVQGLINTALANFTYNETDPKFVAENASIWNAINTKLNETDQRYNDTGLIDSINQTIWNELNNKLNISDQRYNDTGLIDSVNQSLWGELANKLNISDQRYNDTQYIINQLLNYYNKTEIDGLFANYTFNETDPIFVAENITIWQAINSKLNTTDQRYNDTQYIINILLDYYNKTETDNLLDNKLNISDQRYNDTQLITDVNSSVWQELSLKLNISDQRYNDTQYIINQLLNYYNKTEIDGLFANYTFNETDPIFVAENITIWQAINSKLNTTDQRYNDTQYIINILLDYYNKTETDNLLDNKLNISDQRYNDTQLITDVNSSVWQELSLKLNISDQRYNDTQYIINQLLNYYNKTEIDGLFANYTFNETDPIFTAENSSIWNAINSKLNESDQRYNDTQYIINLLLDYYNKTEVDNALDTKLNISDQRYNDTQLITDVNSSIWNELVLKLNISDQRYNDTQYIINALLDYYNKTEIDSLFSNFTWNETDPIFVAENSSIWNAINSKLNISDQRYNDTQYIINALLDYYNKTEVDGLLDNKLNITDQRYNDTQLINDVNNSIWQELALKLNISDQRYNDTQYIINALLNYYNKTEVDAMFGNFTWNETDPIFTAENSSIWNAINTKLNISDQRYNDTQYIINQLLNYYNKTETDNLLDAKLNTTDQRYNETGLINGVNQSVWGELANKLNISDQRYNDTQYIINQLLNYYNKTESDGRYIQNETDPIFVLENTTIWNAINLKLNISDQRYNDTQYIINQLMNYYNKTEVDNALVGKLNITDQRYNDTQLIIDVNTSVWQELALKLNISDQRYNDTQYIINALLDYYNKTEIDGMFTNFTWNETDPIFTAENSTIWQAINNKLNITDQRYNDTQLVLDVNTSIWQELVLKLNILDQRYNDTQYIINALLNYYNKTEIDGMFGNFTWNETDPIFSAENTSIWQAINTKLNISDQRYNDTQYIINALLDYYNKTEVDELIAGINQTITNNYNTTITNYYNMTYIDENFYNTTYMMANYYNVTYMTENYYNQTEINNMFLNFTYNETDPIFTAENATLWQAINSKLNISDQRYNDTQYIINALLDYYNKTESDNRYIQNETDPVFSAENSTIWNAINSKLNISDQRYNDTQYIINTLLDYYNKTEIDNMLVSYIQNETDPVFSAENSTIWNAINSKLNISDQRYNDTQYIINTLLDYYNKTEIDNMLVSYIQNETDPIFTAENSTLWQAINSKLNITDQRYNDTQLITDVNTTGNIQGLGFNTTTQLDTVYYPLNSNPNNYINDTSEFYNATFIDSTFVNNTFLENNFYNNTFIDNNFHNNSFIDNNFYNNSFMENNFYNNSFMNSNFYNNTFMDNNFYNNSFIDSNYYNKTEIDGMFANFTWNETDPIFTAENATLWQAINQKLNITDQRYNDTQYIINALLNYYNKTETDNLIVGKLNTTDQRYNDTQLVVDVNTSVWIELALKLNISDQRYNDTQYIINALLNYYNKTESDARYIQNETDPIFLLENTTIWQAINNKLNISDQRYNDTQYIINQLLNYYNKTEVDNLVSGKLNTTDQRYNDTALINAVNTTSNIQSLGFNTTTELDTLYYSITNPNGYINYSYVNGTYLLITDQRYNDTLMIQAVNNSLGNYLLITDQRYNETILINAVNTTNNIKSLGFNTTTELNNLYYAITNPAGYMNETYANQTYLLITDQRYNDTILIQTINLTIKQPTGPYLTYDNTTFWINESYLNNTINNISKVRKITYNMTCTAVNGTCNIISAINITYEITEVKVTPTTPSNNYKFQLTEYPTVSNIIDKDRSAHVGVWDIEKSYAINGQVQATITNANINELFTTSIIYLTNGVQ